MSNVAKPCADCPFMTSCKPGALGGSPPETFIGQAHGPFLLPCHKHCDFDDPDWKSKVNETPQCAGAAMYREANQIPLPPSIAKLEPVEGLLENPVQFYAHHKQITCGEAMRQVMAVPPSMLLAAQLARQTNKIFPTKKD